VLWCPEKKTSRTELWTLYDIAQAANDSGECNSTELVGYHNGEVLVKVFDWANTFASTFKRIDNLTQYHHFKFNSKEQPGMVKCYKTLESEPIVLNLLKKNAKDLISSMTSGSFVKMERKISLHLIHLTRKQKINEWLETKKAFF